MRSVRRLFRGISVAAQEIGFLRLITIATATVAAIIYVASTFSPRVLTWLEDKHLFEALVLAVVVELLADNARSKLGARSDVEIFTDEHDVQDRLAVIVAGHPVEEVQLLSAGLASRRQLISNLIKAGITVHVVAQDPVSAIDKQDATRTAASLEWIKLDAEEYLQHLQIWMSPNVSSLRAAVITQRGTRTQHVFVGWYTYRNHSGQLVGSQNPTIYVTSGTRSGRDIAQWVQGEITRSLRESELADLSAKTPAPESEA